MRVCVRACVCVRVCVRVCARVCVHSHALREGTEIANLTSEHKIAELGVREEDDEEHDGEAGDVLRAPRQRRLKLSHGAVEAVCARASEKTKLKCYKSSSNFAG